ncbi:MAG: response regulator [Paenibacillaceae bacterium]|nr:response regulator [Paenibacillaceae bacterium]
MNVWIVDDQRLSRAGIIKMIAWDRLGLTLAGECANGREALDRIGNAEADIVITDVRMPVMNGLEMIEQAREQRPDLAFVVISGYDDYPYVRKSIQLTVADYLLKPVDAGELNALLERIVIRLREQKRQTDEDMRKWREQFFHFLLEGVYESDPEQLHTALADIRFAEENARFVPAVFESELDRDAVYDTLRPLAETMAVCAFRTRGVYVLLAAAAGLSADEVSRELARLAAANGALRRIGVGPEAPGIALVRDSIGKAFDAYAILSSQSADKADRSAAATYERLAAEAATFVPISAAWEQEWAFHLRHGNRDAALRKLDELLRIGTTAHPDIADSSYHYVLLRGARELFESGLIREPDYLEACRIAKSLPTIVSLTDKQAGVADFFRSRLAEDEPSLETRQAVEKAKAYIDAHFCETINLSELAHGSFMSPGYFSSLFRQHTGRNFLEYVTHLRMERAKALIAADPEQRIGDVAQQCGYQDVKYFRKLFKRHIGTTPLGYKGEFSGDRQARP